MVRSRKLKLLSYKLVSSTRPYKSTLTFITGKGIILCICVRVGNVQLVEGQYKQFWEIFIHVCIFCIFGCVRILFYGGSLNLVFKELKVKHICSQRMHVCLHHVILCPGHWSWQLNTRPMWTLCWPIGRSSYKNLAGRRPIRDSCSTLKGYVMVACHAALYKLT